MRNRSLRRVPRQRVLAGLPAVTSWGGFDGLTAADYYTANALGGATPSFHIQAWLYIESQAVASANRIPLANVTTATNGHRFLVSGTNSALNFGAYDTVGGVTRTTASLTLTAGHIGRPLHVMGGLRAGQLLLWVDGVAVGAPTAFGTMGPGGNLSIGRRMSDTLSALGDIRVIGGVAGGNYAPSDVEVLAAYTAGLAAKSIVPVPLGTDAAWAFTGLGGALASIAATVGAVALAKSGSPSFVTV